ncbi:hypothetical protein LWE61_11830 [Sphingobium sufflavum]|uniref:hypothetical protein n=1 Tax=Sphingobium sufflavum TaxID=1129547 RepID=UPI001F3275C4|nr:hypothetical protein [Sphingobium sufflavum]MCE7797247.1 hypothetical protein [Sphingobium sufflavum]
MLIDRLFGAEPVWERQMLVAHMATIRIVANERWARDVRDGVFAAIPEDLNWEGAREMAVLWQITYAPRIEGNRQNNACSLRHLCPLSRESGSCYYLFCDNGQSPYLIYKIMKKHSHIRL